jgi:hypothetical protein
MTDVIDALISLKRPVLRFKFPSDLLACLFL